MMTRMTKTLSILAVLVVTFCTGCATKYSDMVRFLPSDRYSAGDADKLFFEINRTSPFEISRGDFKVSHSEDGQTCWVALGDSKRSEALVSFLKKSRSWEYSSTGSVRTTARKNFGLSPKAAEYNRDGSVQRQGEYASVRQAERMEFFQ